jgi:hypothetical protein
VYVVYSTVPIIRPSVIALFLYPTCRIGPEIAARMSHSERLNPIGSAFAYIEQQREATAPDLLLFSHWRDLAAKKGKLRSKYSLLISKKKKLLFTDLHYVKYYFYL